MTTPDIAYKSGNEFAPYHPQASHVAPDYRDGWNACFKAAADELAIAAENERFQREKADRATATVYQFHYAMKDAGWHPGRTEDNLCDIIREKGKELERLRAQVAPAGYVAVPVEPTEEMVQALLDNIGPGYVDEECGARAWFAAIGAIPVGPVETVDLTVVDAAPAQQAEPVGFNGLTEAETAATASVAGIAPSLTVGVRVVPEVAESLLLGQAQQLIGALMNHGLLPKTADEASYLKLWDVVKRQLRCVNQEGGRAALAAQPAVQAEPVAPHAQPINIRCAACDKPATTVGGIFPGCACGSKQFNGEVSYATTSNPPAQAEPVAWRDHVEQRIREWRQRTMNRSGDHLAIDDFMDAEALDDLVDYVCDEWAGQPSKPAAQGIDEQVLERAAEAVYRQLPGSAAHPWVQAGNSLKQDEARSYARAALAQAQKEQP